MSTTLSENKMGVMPVGRLLLSMSVPMIISMLVQALYNVVDSVFVSYYSEAALTAVSYSFPAQNLMIGVATGTAVGVNALLSKSLGEKNTAKANLTASNGVFLSFLSAFVFLIFGLFFSEGFIKIQTATPEIIKAGKEYLTVCCVFSFGVFGQVIFERLMQSTGRTIYTMYTQGLGAVINILLDPFFILSKGTNVFGIALPFGLGLGAKGAAIATVIGQIAAALLALFFNIKRNPDISLSIRVFRPDIAVIGKIYSVAVPSIIMVSIGSVMTISMNMIFHSMGNIGDTAATVLGIHFKLQSFIFMPIFGLNNGLIPIIAYNYGAQKRKRMMKALTLAMAAAVAAMLIGLLLMQLIPSSLLMLFNANEGLISIGVPALRAISLGFIFAGVCISITAMFQALGRGMFAMFVSIARQLIVLVPVAWLLSKTGNIDLVWFSFPIAEVASVLASVLFFVYLYKKVIRFIPAGE